MKVATKVTVFVLVALCGAVGFAVFISKAHTDRKPAVVKKPFNPADVSNYQHADEGPENQPPVGEVRKVSYLYGFMDMNGKVVIRPRFSSVEPFHDGRALVGTDNGMGFIDRQGRLVIALGPRDVAFSFSEGLAPVQLYRQKWGYIDTGGRWVIKPQFDSANAFSDGLAYVQNLDASRVNVTYHGYIDRTGKMVLKGVGGDEFHNGRALVIVDDESSYVIDKTGRRISGNLDRVSSSMLSFSEGMSVYNTSNNLKWGYIDDCGRIVVKQQFSGVRDFSEGAAAVCVDPKNDGGKWGFIDRTGKWLVKPTFSGAGDFSEGLARVSVSPGYRTYGYINKAGKWVIKPRFEAGTDFHCGLALVVVGDKYVYIDKRGKPVVKRNQNLYEDLGLGHYDEVWQFSEGLVAISVPVPVAAKSKVVKMPSRDAKVARDR